MGMVFQHFNLFPNMTIRKNITLAPVRTKLLTQAEADDTATTLLRRVGLEDKADSYPAQLSGGQKQRIAIAGVIAMRPRCVVLDEPTAMLDPIGRDEVLKTIRLLNREYGMTVVLITHHMDEAAQADRLVGMHYGCIVADGRPADVFQDVVGLRALGLEVPETVGLMYEPRKSGVNVPLDALDVDSCAAALYALLA